MGCGALRAARCMISVYSGAIETGLPMSVECAFSFFLGLLACVFQTEGGMEMDAMKCALYYQIKPKELIYNDTALPVKKRVRTTEMCITWPMKQMDKKKRIVVLDFIDIAPCLLSHVWRE
jgi:hypothetical protein